MARLIGPPCTASVNNGPAVGAELTAEQEQIEITSGTATKPDMRWEYVDQSGHFHAYDQDGKLPTLHERIEQMPCPGGCDDPGCEGYTVTRYHCSICGEEIEPQRLPDLEPKYMPGRMSWSVVVEQEIPHGETVSVRVTAGDRVAFGVAVSAGVDVGMVGGEVFARTTLVDASPLGWRKAASAAV